MKKLFPYIILALILSCCKSNGNETQKSEVLEQKESNPVEEAKISEKIILQNQSDTIAETQESEKKYVAAENGLTIRDKPSIDAVKIGTLSFGTEISIVEKTDIQLKIEDEGKTINGQWVKIKTGDQKKGYIFDGFLTDEIRSNLFMVSYNPKWKGMELKLSFSKISDTDFTSHKNNYDSKITKDSTVKQDSSFFAFKTSETLYKLYNNRTTGNPRFDYFGYLEPLNSQIIGGGGDGIYEMFLVEMERDSVAHLFAFSDSNSDVPVISPDNSKLISFQSAPGSDLESYIALYDIAENSLLKNYITYETSEWRINEIVWIDNKSIALKVYDNYRGKDKNGEKKFENERYFKATME
ncbi:SH3 domain-containing protein [Maribacter sp. 2304DJ31-5]|uniref:SH3 domain-containing protein n=1 Tax=Maribacter sp. 2304DJ31-5 TaxID=3386273 RepID=UPI0039BCA2D2